MSDTKKRIMLFLITVLILCYSISFFMMYKGGLDNPNASAFFSLIKLTPLFAVIITQFFTREGFKNEYFKLNFRDNVPSYFIAFFLVQALVAVGIVAYFLCFPQKFDGGFASMAAKLTEQGHVADASKIASLMIVTVMFQVISGPFMNIFFAFAEEYGWHGYLFPKLCETVSPFKASILTGITWGIFYAPMVSMGYVYNTDYIGYPFAGIFAMTVFCVFFGITLSFFTYKTKSVFPAVLMHSAFNVCMSTGTLFVYNHTSDPFIGPSPTGIIGGAGFIICGIICAVLLRKEKTK